VHAQVELRRQLGAIGMTHVRPTAGAEQHHVGLLAGTQSRLGQRTAGARVVLGTDWMLFEGKREPADPRLERTQHLECGCGDFYTNSVARQHCNAE